MFYGDSITHGVTHTHGWRSFAEIFTERVRWEMRFVMDIVIDSGIAGDSSTYNEEFYEWRVNRWKPNAVFLLTGINDICIVNDLGKTRQNLITLVRNVRAHAAIPILQTYGLVTAADEKRFKELPAYNDVIRQVAEAEDVILVDHDRFWRQQAPEADVSNRWLDDAIHPGAAGHLALASEIFRTLGIYDPQAPCCNPPGVPGWTAPSEKSK